MAEYAMLQLLYTREPDLAREHVIYIISSYMDARGLMPCSRESAERTVSFVRLMPSDETAGRGGWAVYDDEADRLEVGALDGLGRYMTDRLRCHAVGVMGENDTRLLRLYRAGKTVDTYITAPGSLGRVGRWIACRGHAVRWSSLLPKGGGIAALSDAFELGEENAPAGFAAVRRELCLHDSCTYGFSSLEEAAPPGVVTLFFCASNHVRQRWYDRILHPLTGRRAEAGVSIRNVK